MYFIDINLLLLLLHVFSSYLFSLFHPNCLFVLFLLDLSSIQKTQLIKSFSISVVIANRVTTIGSALIAGRIEEPKDRLVSVVSAYGTSTRQSIGIKVGGRRRFGRHRWIERARCRRWVKGLRIRRVRGVEWHCRFNYLSSTCHPLNGEPIVIVHVIQDGWDSRTWLGGVSRYCSV